jgi:hypothetical protein
LHYILSRASVDKLMIEAIVLTKCCLHAVILFGQEHIEFELSFASKLSRCSDICLCGIAIEAHTMQRVGLL